VYYGPTGVGKSERVRQECFAHGLDLWVNPCGPAAVWFDGYDGHAAALLDDFTGCASFRDLLRILDGYEVLVQVKASHRRWRPDVVFITSDRYWEYWTFGQEGHRSTLSEDEKSQLRRRISLCEEIRAEVPLNEALGMPPLLQAPTVGVGLGGDNRDCPPQAPFSGLDDPDLDYYPEVLNLD